ncbi:hypothetical protein LF65_02858 [Clostridium beijerinckii]|uniref:Uncharacterized protein n=1 Tax=Clostridium beijerinckii TaxID=1520 RepID=A0A0B5QRA9_CLOBE|nr:hypothetical protein [Clostridium beijerinckii]AJG99428.1 hypothetical protein LF65_02858 [Clostridium beijerinckii]
MEIIDTVPIINPPHIDLNASICGGFLFIAISLNEILYIHRYPNQVFKFGKLLHKSKFYIGYIYLQKPNEYNIEYFNLFGGNFNGKRL